MEGTLSTLLTIWVVAMVVKIMVPFGVLIIIPHLIFRVPKKGAIILTTTHIPQTINPKASRLNPKAESRNPLTASLKLDG